MNITKLLIATVAGFVVMFLLSGLVHMKLFTEFYMSHATAPCNVYRPEPMLMYIALGILLLSFMMAWMYPKGVESSNKLMEGLKFGVMMGIIWITPLNLVLYGVYDLSSRAVIGMDFITSCIIQGLGGIVIAYVYGDSVMPKARS